MQRLLKHQIPVQQPQRNPAAHARLDRERTLRLPGHLGRLRIRLLDQLLRPLSCPHLPVPRRHHGFRLPLKPIQQIHQRIRRLNLHRLPEATIQFIPCRLHQRRPHHHPAVRQLLRRMHHRLNLSTTGRDRRHQNRKDAKDRLHEIVSRDSRAHSQKPPDPPDTRARHRIPPHS